MRFPHPLLVCDIGGTNVRVAVSRTRGGPPEMIFKARTTDYPDLASVLGGAARAAAIDARSAIVCAAGPVEGACVSLTNAEWSIDGRKTAAALGLDQGLLLNDFEAQAIALPYLPTAATREIAAGEPHAGAPMLVLGPGTGLGAAALLRVDGKWTPVTTEAGHAGFAPQGADEQAIWPHLEPAHGRVTFESVLSGPGLAHLYAALRAQRGLAPSPVDAAGVEAAARGGDQTAVETIRVFWRLAARCAGDLALVFLAKGGVTLAGGVLPRLVDWLEPQSFQRAFSDKAPMANLLARVPLRLLVDTDAVLAGLAALAAEPDAFALDYAARAWCKL